MTTESDIETRVPSLLYSETEEELRKVIRDVIEDVCPWTVVIERLDLPQAHDPRLWRNFGRDGYPCAADTRAAWRIGGERSGDGGRP